MKIFTRVLFTVVILSMAGIVSAQSLQGSVSHDSKLYGRSGLTQDVDKTNYSSPVTIYSYNNSVFVSTTETNLNNAKFAVFTTGGQMVTIKNISSSSTKYDMESSQKGLFIVKALVNGKVYTKKVYIF
jgi:hypothetical protein